jgi:hypothetical protein
MQEPPEPDDPPRVRLEYFAANAPREKLPTRVLLRWVMLVLGWLPFACGVASSRAVVRSGMADVIRVHVNAGAMFMGIGALISTACCIVFLRAREWSGAIIAAISLLAQVSLFLCTGGIQ